MTQSTLQKDSDGTIKLTITLPVADIKKAETEEIEKAVKNAILPGFREGKAPRELVEEKLDKEKIQGEILKKLLPQAYIKAVEEHKVKPIINPKIHVQKIEKDKDWIFTAETCEMPEITLNKYKDAVQKITAKSKIVIPGKETPKPNLEEIIQALLKEVKVVIPALLIDNEVERQLSQLLAEIKKLGLTLDQYLGSTGKTPQSVRDEYASKAQNDLRLEFALQKIADTEKLTVEEKEIDEAILKAKDDTEKKQLEQNKYLLASILRQQKTLDFIKSL